MSQYLVQETASKLLLENGTGALQTEQNDILFGQAFFPTFPDRIPPVTVPHAIHWQTSAATEVPLTIPIPDILATRRFLPMFPERIPRPGFPRELNFRTSEAVIFPIANPLAWLPYFPDHPVKVQPRDPQAIQAFVSPAAFADVSTASRLAWAPSFPDRIPLSRSRAMDVPVTFSVPPTFIAGGVPCTALLDSAVTRTDLIQELLTVTDLRAEGLARTDLVAETVCDA